jgi:transposase
MSCFETGETVSYASHLECLKEGLAVVEICLDMEGEVVMNGRDLRKWRLIEDVIKKNKSQIEVSTELELSERQVRRLVSKAKADGIKGLIHGLKGKVGNRAMAEELKQQVLDIWEKKYRSCRLNFSHFTEKLNEVEGVKIGRESVRQILRAKGVSDRVAKKGRKHRRFRERKAQFGELLQQDTSPHDWLGTGQKLHLVVIVDDATSKLLFCRLFEHDGTLPNMVALKEVFLKYGLPMAAYTDRASWFFYTPKHRTVDGPKPVFSEVDKSFKTQIGRALDELGVEFIPAYSPQAKGRVERANGTLQDRLIAELKLLVITEMNMANKFIDEIFIDDYNKRFGHEPRNPEPAFVSVKSPEQIDEIMCIKFVCKVGKDNTVMREKYFKLQLEPTSDRINWAQARVEVRMYPDGRARVLHLPSGKDVPFTVIELRQPHEAKNPSELPEVQKISA